VAEGDVIEDDGWVLLAELTHRCPLGCPYCSNPLAMDSRDDELDAGTWSRVFKEAAALGVLHVHLSGGEPGARRDLVDIAANAREAGLYTSLITSGVGITTRTMRDLWEAGLDHVQVSFQDADAVSADRIAGYRGAFQRQHALAAEAVRLGLPLTVNLMVHRANIERISDMVDLALKLKAGRIEIAHVQYYGWALKNRAALMPTAEQVARAVAEVEELRRKHHGKIVIDAGVPDHHARCPKRCAGGWGRRSLNITPSGRVLPCHAAESIPGLTFWNVRDHALGDIWANSPAFNAFRGTDFLPAPRVCHLSPHDAGVAELAAVQQDTPYAYRRM
jgi:pyrroloquinoline quinone biosynthesis protein E